MTRRRYLTHRSTEGDGRDDLFTDRPAWQQHAACRGIGPNFWFFTPARRDDHGSIRKASEAAKAERIAYCNRCPVRRDCAIQALEDGAGAYQSVRAGVWIGDSRDHRRLIAIATHTEVPEWQAFVEATS